jgi:transposase
MVFTGKFSAEKRAYIRLLGKTRKYTAKEVADECKVSLPSVYRIWNDKFGNDFQVKNKNKDCGGRPEKLTLRQKRSVLRNLNILREENSNFTSKNLLLKSGINPNNISSRTLRRFLNRSGYHYLQARKKGIMSKTDVRKRYNFAKRIKKDYGNDVWTKQVAFYLDGVSFTHKTNPADQAKAPKGRIWRKPNEGMDRGCTAKGSHEGSGGKLVKMMVAISHGKGVVLCDQYDKLDGPYFKDLVFREFPKMFRKARKGRSRLWLQDGDPSQNSAVARMAMKSVRAKLMSIPARSPDLNPIENLFHLIKRQLNNDAIVRDIKRENFQEFSARVKSTILNFDNNVIDKIIESMSNRIEMVVNRKGSRIRY